MALGIAMLAGSVGAVALYVFFVEPLWALPGLERITPNLVYRVRTNEPLVGLSFDDGPHPKFTPQVLDILERHGAKATFFLIGERALREQNLVARIRASGHEIGNHYFENGPTLLHPGATFARKLEDTERAIGLERGSAVSEKGGRAALFRPPGGVAWPWQLRLAKERGYTCVLGCAYPHDPMRPPLTYMRWLIKKNLRPGAIVILHDGIRNATKSIEVLPQILAEGERRGLKFVSISNLIKDDGLN